jgi:hypothetical protein
MRDLRRDAALAQHVPTIDYVVGVLSAGDAYRPNFNLSMGMCFVLFSLVWFGLVWFGLVVLMLLLL